MPCGASLRKNRALRVSCLALSKTTNPENIESFIQELATAVSKKMEKDGLLKKA